MSSPESHPPRTALPLLQFASLFVAVACSIFIVLQLQPSLILTETTPAGGDMGAHVWGPAYLRDHLLPNFRLTGWTPDWYAGFPAYHFYMLVPSLLIVLVNSGISGVAGIIAGLVVLVVGLRLGSRAPRLGTLIEVASILLAIGLVQVPYGISFKIVSIIGVALMPLAAWLMARLAGATEPVPAFVALGTTVFLFDTNFTIYGGNILSTLAGEFAFSIGLALALIAIGLSIKGMDDSSYRGIAAVVFALVALSHILPLMLMVIAVTLTVFVGRETPRLWLIGLAVTGFVALWLAEWELSALMFSGALSFLIVAGAILGAEPTVRRRALWLLMVGPVGALLAFFWLVPFLFQHSYFNDMGWERLEDTVPALLTTPMKIAIPFAVVGAIFAFATRDRIGIVFSMVAMIAASAVMNLPEGPLWNARMLPFFYLSVYIVAGIGGAYVLRFVGVALTENFSAPHQGWIAFGTASALVITLVWISIPLRVMPFGTLSADGAYSWMGLTNKAGSPVPGWSRWNYSGYERKPSYREYRDVVASMEQLGEQQGCGRAMWEYDADLNRYGTPMALMLLPFWTDGCIGSMEGLFFESSASTPFHFLNQSALSDAPSRAQRNLPYQGFDIELGIGQLQTSGVRYYMALSDKAIAAARSHEGLTERAISEPWVIFEVNGAVLVEGLGADPVVVTGPADDAAGVEDRFDAGWVSQAVEFYNNADTATVLPASSGPDSWKSLGTTNEATETSFEPVSVSDIAVGRDSISFSVDEIGKPVLVKVSYFPNWKADGADGPWQAGPNLMVVIPTETDVSLSYGRTIWDWLGIAATVLGLVLLVAMVRWQSRRNAPPDPDSVADPLVAEAPSDEADVAVVDPREGELVAVGSANAAPETLPDDDPQQSEEVSSPPGPVSQDAVFFGSTETPGSSSLSDDEMTPSGSVELGDEALERLLGDAPQPTVEESVTDESRAAEEPNEA